MAEKIHAPKVQFARKADGGERPTDAVRSSSSHRPERQKARLPLVIGRSVAVGSTGPEPFGSLFKLTNSGLHDPQAQRRCILYYWP